MGLYERQKELIVLLIPFAIIIWAINLEQWDIVRGAIFFWVSEGAVLGYLKLREERKKNQEKRLTKLNDGVFKRWMSVSKSRMLFQINIPIDENIDTVLLEDAITFLNSKRKKYGQILKLRKKIIEIKNNYNSIGENIETKIYSQLSIVYPSLESIESRQVTGKENCYITDNIINLIYYRLKRNFLKNGVVKWDNIHFKNISEDGIWRLISNLAWRVFIQSKNKIDVYEECFKNTMEELIIKILSDDLKQQVKLIKGIDQKLSEFKDEVHRLSIDIEMDRV